MSTETAAKERPILFSGPMLRAILSGAKTQTRRVVKPQLGPNADWVPWEGIGWKAQGIIADIPQEFRTGTGLLTCPHGVAGDRLWVRETWRPYSDDDLFDSIRYAADGAIQKPQIEDSNIGLRFSEDCDRWGKHGANRSPIHMPRWASRITLEITDVRVERVQDISEADAAAEGVGRIELSPAPLLGEHNGIKMYGHPATSTHEHAFRVLWDTINEKRGFGWDVNPWVFALTFKRV